MTLSVLSVLIGRSTLCFLVTGDIGTSWLAVCALCSDSPLPTTECLQATPSAGSSSSWDRSVYSAATFPATISSQFRLNLQERATINKIICEPEQTIDSQQISCYNISLLAKVNNKLWYHPITHPVHACMILNWHHAEHPTLPYRRFTMCSDTKCWCRCHVFLLHCVIYKQNSNKKVWF